MFVKNTNKVFKFIQYISFVFFLLLSINVASNFLSQACTFNADCQAGQTCTNGSCTGPVTCNPVCGLGYTCVGICTQITNAPNGSSCSTNANCQSGYCNISTNTCADLSTQPCVPACGVGYQCNAGACTQITNAPNGSSCSTNANCQSGYCDPTFFCAPMPPPPGLDSGQGGDPNPESPTDPALGEEGTCSLSFNPIQIIDKLLFQPAFAAECTRRCSFTVSQLLNSTVTSRCRTSTGFTSNVAVPFANILTSCSLPPGATRCSSSPVKRTCSLVSDNTASGSCTGGTVPCTFISNFMTYNGCSEGPIKKKCVCLP